jgi:type IV secretion system protein VirB6
MSAACEQAAGGLGNGIAAALQAVDCVAGETTAQAFGRLFAPGGSLVPVLTILLTLFIAFFAIALLLGRTNLSVKSLVPRMMTLGLVVTFATSWIAYQSVVWNLAIGGPDELAGILTASNGSATTVFAQKIDVVFQAVQQATQGQEADIGAFSPQGLLWMGAMLFLLGTVGVLVTARIGLALLVALGPIFVVMALFNGTRGLFTGWLKGVVMLALTPLLAVLGGSVMLELAVPVLSSLAQTPGQVDPQAAMAFFLVGAVHVALMIMTIKVAGTMVSGWRVFGMVPEKGADRGDSPAPMSRAAAAPAAAAVAPSQQQPGTGQQRQIPVTAFATSSAANENPSGAAATAHRTTHVVSTASGGAQVTPFNPSLSRTRGIGSRFRAPPQRPTEKLK